MPLDALVREGQIIAQTFWFVRSIEALDRTDHAVKFRLHIDRDLFIQVYVNVRKGKTNFALISGGQRIFGRDCEGGGWHRHPFEDLTSHDFSQEGSRVVALTEFVIEVEGILVSENLI